MPILTPNVGSEVCEELQDNALIPKSVFPNKETVTVTDPGHPLYGHECELVVHTEQQIELLEARSDLRLTVWLKLDTGMHRLGFPVTRAVELIDRLRACSAVAELRLMTHLANADDPRDQKTDSQLAAFADVAESFDGDISIANSGGIFGWPTAVRPPYVAAGASIWIRPGIALYGISPFPELNGADLGLQPAMQFESRLIAVKDIRAGDSVGYGGRWRADKDTTIGIISAGYGDGLTGYLASGTPVMVNGNIVPLVGAVSMDMAAVDLGPNSDDHSGDPVLIWGEELPVEDIARRAGILAYQLVCGVMHRENSSISR